MFSKTARLLLVGQSKTSRTEITEQYFADKVSSMMVVAFDSPLTSDGVVRATHWRDGFVVKEQLWERPRWLEWSGSLSAVFAFFFIGLRIVFLLCRERESFVISLGIANFSTLCITLASKLRFAPGRIIYYCLDLYPAPAANLGDRIIHFFYCWSEKVLVKTSDLVWDISPNIVDGRQLLLGIDAESYRAIEVPGGYPKSYLGEYSRSERIPAAIGFIGTLSANQGVQMAIEAMPALAKLNPSICLHVVGKGPYAEDLRSLVAKVGVTDRVIFHGFLPEAEAFEVLRRCQFGLGIWTGDEEDTSTYADPGKPKVYALLGLPIIITRYTPLARTVEECKSGLVISYNRDEYIDAVQTLLTDAKAYQQVYDGLETFKEFCLIDPILDKAVNDTNMNWL